MMAVFGAEPQVRLLQVLSGPVRRSEVRFDQDCAFDPLVDFASLGNAVREAEHGGADYIHVDVMDGHFVPNLSVGPAIVSAVRRNTLLPLDVHLMVEAPERFLEDFAKAGANIISIHVEACRHLHRAVEHLRELGVKPSITLNPMTNLETLWKCCLSWIRYWS